MTVQLDTAAGSTSPPSARAEKDLAAARAEIDATERKLGNPSFIERAPAGGRQDPDRLADAQDDVAGSASGSPRCRRLTG